MDTDTKVNQMLELPDKEFKVGIMKINHKFSWNKWKNEKISTRK